MPQRIERNRKPTQAESLLAGMLAGAVEGAVTYPTEFLKTRAQLGAPAGQKPSIVATLRTTLAERGPLGLYKGAGALITGNAVKAGVRFLTYDTFKEQLRDRDGKLTPLRNMLAGLGAGTAEAVIAVTPSETIKTKLIQDASLPQPKFTSTLNGTITICRTEGLGGLYRGVGPTIAKQATNSAVRFTSYSTLQTALLEYLKPPSGKLSSTQTFGIGAIAGLITVYCTMPLDNVKTRMQSLTARQLYRNSFDCFASIVRNEGVRALWNGTSPRLVRLMMSGGIIFTVYEKSISVMHSLH